MIKKDNEDFESCTKSWICGTSYVDDNVKVRDHCHVTGINRGFSHRDCNIKLKLIQNISTVLLDLKSYNSHLIIQEAW